MRISDWSSDVCSSDLRVGEEFELPGPVGERNLYALRPRGRIALQASTPTGLRIQLGAVLATGNSAVVSAEAVSTGLLGLPDTVLAKIAQVENAMSTEDIATALIEGGAKEIANASDRKSTRLNSSH